MNTCREALVKEVSDILDVKKEDVDGVVEVPPKIELGDYAFPCFTLGENPVGTAKKVSEELEKRDYVRRVDVKGPYVNVFVSTKMLLKSVSTDIPQQDSTVLIEYPSPNVNKPLHIGHARNIAIGKSVSNLLKKQGKTVKQHNLFNDRGVHICKSILAYTEEGKGEIPEETGEKPDHFVGRYYQRFSKLVKEDDSYSEKAQSMLKKWEEGDEDVLREWEKLREWCLEGIRTTLNRLDVHHDKEVYESDIYKIGKKQVVDNLGRGVFETEDDGSIHVDLEDLGLGKKYVLRKDGTTMYITQDIGLSIQRFDEGVDKIIYVVGKEQQYHFDCLFAILEKMGYSAASLEHLGYGFVTLTTGKMSSREGTVVLIDDVLDEVTKLAEEELEDRYGEIYEERAEKIGVAALLFSLLRQDTQKDMVFDPEKSMSFKGETGPYLLYTYARICSVLEEYGEVTDVLHSDEERSVLRALVKWPQVVSNAAKTRKPSKVANALLDVAQAYNEFYHAHRIQVEDEDVRSARQVLTKKTKLVLQDGFELLGLPYVEEM